VDNSIPKRVLITGCGRSGTKYITFVLRRLGLDVGHERMGDDGIASWCMAVNAESVAWGVSASRYSFEHVLHQVRHPLDAIASIATFKEPSWRFICAHAPIVADEPVLLRSAKYWYHWNLEAEKIAHWRYAVEQLPEHFEEFCERLQLQPKREALERVSHDVNTRKLGRAAHIHEELSERLRIDPNPLLKRWLARPAGNEVLARPTWEDLAALDLALGRDIQDKAQEYGYVV
jgi:hypothetical protein